MDPAQSAASIDNVQTILDPAQSAASIDDVQTKPNCANNEASGNVNSGKLSVNIPRVLVSSDEDVEPPPASVLKDNDNNRRYTAKRRNTQLNAFIRIMGLKWKQKVMQKKEQNENKRESVKEELLKLEQKQIGEDAKKKQMATAASKNSFQAINDSYKNSGNLEFYSDANLMKREHLLDHPHIQHTLLLWWTVVLNRYVGRNIDQSYKHNGLKKNEYMEFHKALYKVFNSSLQIDPIEWAKTAEEDWQEDCHDDGMLTEAGFKKSLFELADIWCETIGVVEYCDFINYTMTKLIELKDENAKTVSAQKGDFLHRKKSIKIPSYLLKLLGSHSDAKQRTSAKMRKHSSTKIINTFREKQLAELKLEFLRVAGDDNAALTPKQFNEALTRLGINLSSEEITELFSASDRDGNGTIDYREFILGVNTIVHNTETEDGREKILKVGFDLYRPKTATYRPELPSTVVVNENSSKSPSVNNFQSPIHRRNGGLKPANNQFIEADDFVKIMEVVGLTTDDRKTGKKRGRGGGVHRKHRTQSNLINEKQMLELANSPISSINRIKESSDGLKQWNSSFKLKEPLTDRQGEMYNDNSDLNDFMSDHDYISNNVVSTTTKNKYCYDLKRPKEELDIFERLYLNYSYTRRRREIIMEDTKKRLEAEKKVLYRGVRAPNVIKTRKVSVGSSTKWSPQDKAKLLSDEICVANLHRAGFKPLKIPHWMKKKKNEPFEASNNMLESMDQLPSGQAHIGHSEAEDPNHVTCTMVSRPLRPLGKGEQAVNKNDIYKRRLESLDNSQIHYVQNTVVLDPVQVPQIHLRHGTPSIRRPLSISPSIKKKKRAEKLTSAFKHNENNVSWNDNDHSRSADYYKVDDDYNYNYNRNRNNDNYERESVGNFESEGNYDLMNNNENSNRPTTPLLTSVTVEPKIRPSTTSGPISSPNVHSKNSGSSSMSDLNLGKSDNGINKRPMTVAESKTSHHSKIYHSTSLPIVQLRQKTTSRKMKRKPPLPITPNKNNRKKNTKEFSENRNGIEAGGSSIIDTPAPATPRIGNALCNTVVSVSRTLSTRESIVPEDIHADAIWDKKNSKSQIDTPNTFYISSTDNEGMDRMLLQTATSSATRPGTKGREISSGPVQYRGLRGRNETNNFYHHCISSRESLRDIFNRSFTPMHEQQIYKQAKLRARLKPGVLLPMGLGERYSVEILK